MYLYASHLPACQVLDENCETLHDTTLHDRLMEATNYCKMSLDISAGNQVINTLLNLHTNQTLQIYAVYQVNVNYKGFDSPSGILATPYILHEFHRCLIFLSPS